MTTIRGAVSEPYLANEDREAKSARPISSSFLCASFRAGGYSRNGAYTLENGIEQLIATDFRSEMEGERKNGTKIGSTDL